MHIFTYWLSNKMLIAALNLRRDVSLTADPSPDKPPSALAQWACAHGICLLHWSTHARVIITNQITVTFTLACLLLLRVAILRRLSCPPTSLLAVCHTFYIELLILSCCWGCSFLIVQWHKPLMWPNHNH